MMFPIVDGNNLGILVGLACLPTQVQFCTSLRNSCEPRLPARNPTLPLDLTLSAVWICCRLTPILWPACVPCLTERAPMVVGPSKSQQAGWPHWPRSRTLPIRTSIGPSRFLRSVIVLLAVCMLGECWIGQTLGRTQTFLAIGNLSPCCPNTSRT